MCDWARTHSAHRIRVIRVVFRVKDEFFGFVGVVRHIKLSHLCKLSRVTDPVTNMSGMTAVIQNCKIVKRSGKKKGGGTYEEALNVYWSSNDDRIILPLAFARRAYKDFKVQTTEPREPKDATRRPLEHQVDIMKRAMELLIRLGGVLLECDPGMGKTFMSLYLGLMFRLPIMVIVARVDYAEQWALEFCEITKAHEGKICVMGSATDRYPRFSCDPAKANILFIRAPLLQNLSLEMLARYKFIILDETQMLGTDAQLAAMMRLAGASYVVGCSATPDKPDGRERALELFMGTEAISARWNRPFHFVLFPMNVNTSEKEYERLMKKPGTGPVPMHMAEYGEMERAIAYHPITCHRIAILAHSLVTNHDHKLIVITKYLYQAEYLNRILLSMGITSTIYSGQNKEYDGFAQVTIGSAQVAMAAFDQAKRSFDRRFSAGIMAQSLAQGGNMWQAVGRVMRVEKEKIPLFIWLQYPMNAYKKHVEEIMPTILARKAIIKEPEEYVPSEISKRYMENVVTVPEAPEDLDPKTAPIYPF